MSSNLERIKAEAMQELVGDDDAALGQLWGMAYAAFDQWKQEHGNRKPKAHLGMLSDLVGAKSIPFKKAAPWQCADFQVPAGPIALAIKLLREDYAPFKAITAKVGIRKVLALLIVGFGDDASEGDLDEAIRILRAHANIEVGLRAGFDAARKNHARSGAVALHGKPGGNWEKRDLIRAAWATGKYSSRDICAEQECEAEGMSFSAARKALRGTPNPT
jgi:hypothetical protein